MTTGGSGDKKGTIEIAVDNLKGYYNRENKYRKKENQNKEFSFYDPIYSPLWLADLKNSAEARRLDTKGGRAAGLKDWQDQVLQLGEDAETELFWAHLDQQRDTDDTLKEIAKGNTQAMFDAWVKYHHKGTQDQQNKALKDPRNQGIFGVGGKSMTKNNGGLISLQNGGLIEAYSGEPQVYPYNKAFPEERNRGLISLQAGGNPYAYEDMVENAMYESPQESVNIEAPSWPDPDPNVNDQDETEQLPSTVVSTAAMEDAYAYKNWAGMPLFQEAGATIPPEQIDLLRSYDPDIHGERLEKTISSTSPEPEKEKGWFSPGWGWRAAQRAATGIGMGALGAATGMPGWLLYSLGKVGGGMFQHHKNIRKYGRDYRDDDDIVAQLKEQGKFVDIEAPSREWWDEDSQEEFSSPWWKRRGMDRPDLGLRRLDQPFNEPGDMRYGRAYKAGGLISLQAGGNPIANNFTKYIQEGINSGIRSMVANAYAQGNIPPPSSPQLNQSQLLNQGLTMAPNTANMPVPQQPQQPQQPPAQSNISNVYAQSTQPQSYYMQPNQIR
jgi:hypothetical protein